MHWHPCRDRNHDMTQDLLKRYGGAVPRYTSYPTAPHFSDDVTEDIYRAHLATLPPDQPISLYAHIPYCDTLCWFCGCHTKITRQYKPVDTYTKILVKELELLAEAMSKPVRMSHMHWGGGSPTLLSVDDMKRLARTAIALFRPTEDFDFAVEIDPRETGSDRIAALAECGLTRASIGIQDFDPEVQKAINRMQSFEETEAAVRALRLNGVKNLNFDLMYGLPHQTLQRTLDTVDQAVSLRPSRVALFGYAHVPWMKSHQRMIPEDALPGPEERLEASQAAADRLVEAGYRQIGMDHFALPDDSMSKALDQGTLRRNFQGYTTDRADTLLGVGASSIGRLPGLFTQNESSLKTHARLVEGSHLPIAKGVKLSKSDQIRSKLIERLMCRFEVDIRQLCAEFNADPATLADAAPSIQTMAKDGLVSCEDLVLKLLPLGKPYVRQVAACFDEYFVQKHGQHSQAV